MLSLKRGVAPHVHLPNLAPQLPALLPGASRLPHSRSAPPNRQPDSRGSFIKFHEKMTGSSLYSTPVMELRRLAMEDM